MYSLLDVVARTIRAECELFFRSDFSRDFTVSNKYCAQGENGKCDVIFSFHFFHVWNYEESGVFC
jgi:hypothetical protein